MSCARGRLDWRRRGIGRVRIGWRRVGSGGEPCDLVSRHRAAEVRHRPPGGEHLGLVLARSPQHELAFRQSGDRGIDGRHVDRPSGARQAVEQPGLVAIGLQPADHPRSGVRHRLVVEVDRILGRQHHADTERSSLLHQRQDRFLGRWHRRRWQVAGDLVHVQQRSEIARPALAAHPGDQLGEDERRDELALVVGEVCRRHDRASSSSVSGVQHRCEVECRSLRPRRERWGCQQSVELHGQGHAVVGGEELVDVEHAELADRRRRNHRHERREVEWTVLAPRVVDQVRQQDVLATGERVGRDAHQSQQAGDVSLDLVGDRFGVGHVTRDLK